MAYKNDRHFSYYSSSPFRKQFGHEAGDFHKLIDQALYESDDFRMYAYKIKKCPKLRSHDWTSCPFTHRGEKARRRDPQRYNYLPIPCPSFKAGECVKGDGCELCHGVFEYWLHPAKYRTHPCNAGTLCERKVCFFAHTLRELRSEVKYNWCYVYLYPLHIQPYPDILIENGPNGGWMIIPSNPQPPSPPPPPLQYYNTFSEHGNSSSTNNHEFLIPSSSSTSSSRPSQNVENTTNYELFIPFTSQSQPRIEPQVQNQTEFSLFSASHARLTEELKNFETGNSSSRVNNIHDYKGKRPLEWENQDQEFPNINWVSDLLVDEV
ncbi:PREDICTED: zinc finger CCCH domain-containing protein 23-like [Nicotiana attenuata]|uniref:Zinc finger ccch domain-containing protein 54 n=1 Tax=Nicotiana attenuata TaxID=49451 RepID=A0A1J6I3C8_NICAT|nr:PREDICTED: zinc finger CCCH domain-containing protein 23-like [Nicotiana attenuata]OIS99027.1 zinc finger ccch domain-containing protein 54 [Nicotiana attenuata]